MDISIGNKYRIEVRKAGAGGSAWLVRLYKKRLIGRKLVSSDWFLDEAQAKHFAEELATDLRDGITLEPVLRCPPGWTLHRPER